MISGSAMDRALLAQRPLSVRIGDRLVRPAVNRVVARYSAVPDVPVLGAAGFPGLAPLAAAWRTIRDEALEVLAQRDAVPPLKDISPDHADIATDDKWKSFFFVGYGHPAETNRRRCPATAALVDAVPGLNSAFFSILEPGARIPPHVGVTKGLLTCHLGLVVPGGDCRMRVAGRDMAWREGECLVFDDTYEHSVWNDTPGVRVVLLVQFRRPVHYPGKLAADAFLWAVRRSAFVKDSVEGFNAWEEAYRRAEAARPS